jgi:hypothetical protein
MDYRILLAAPLAALALTASGRDDLQVPKGWFAGSSYAFPQGNTYEAGLATDLPAGQPRALTIRPLGRRTRDDIGTIGQPVMGYAGRRVRFSAQVKATGIDGWAGLVLGSGFVPLYLLPAMDEDAGPPAVGVSACPQWCDVSVVADIPADSEGAASVALALVGNGQVWARGFKVEAVGPEVPVSTYRFAADVATDMAAQRQNVVQLQAAHPTPPSGLDLQ